MNMNYFGPGIEMNFLTAVKHAAIGYGIRRKGWGPASILSMDNFGDLRWVNNPHHTIAQLLGPERTIDLTEEDIKAKDWEIV